MDADLRDSPATLPPPAAVPPGRGRKAVVAMSGGVDSSVTALLLKLAGYEVVGCFMRLGSPDETDEPAAEEGAAQLPEDTDCASGACRAPGRGEREALSTGGRRRARHRQGCCSVNDATDARRVAACLDIPLYVVNFRRDFHRIMDYFVAEYNAGRTPNPCVRCNDWLKFGRLWSYARSIDADFVATGHYARILHSDGEDVGLGTARSDRPRLLRGLDESKDQSYVLFGVGDEPLRRTLLPIGWYHKDRVRDIAEAHALPVYNKPDSQEICFVPDQDYAGLIDRRAPEAMRPGPIVDTRGRVLGEHTGHQKFTVGQRRGLNLQAQGPRTVPLYVLERRAGDNAVVVGERHELGAIGCIADEARWHDRADQRWRPCRVKVRYNGPALPGRVRAVPAVSVHGQTGAGSAHRPPRDGRIEIAFDEPIEAVTPGQAVVCYVADEHPATIGDPLVASEHAGERVLCGGWITIAVQSAETNGQPAPTAAERA